MGTPRAHLGGSRRIVSWSDRPCNKRAISLLATTGMDLEGVAVDDADDLDYGCVTLGRDRNRKKGKGNMKKMHIDRQFPVI